MTKKKTLLEEGTVRQFMKLANLRPLASDFVNKIYEEEEKKVSMKEHDPGLCHPDDPQCQDNKKKDEDLVEVDLGEEEELEMGAEAELEGPEGEEEVEVGAEEELGGEEEAETEVSITPEEAEVIIGLGSKLSAAGEGEEEMELGGEEELEVDAAAEVEGPEGSEEIAAAGEEEIMEKMIARIAENVTNRVKKMSQKRPAKRKMRNRK